MDVWLTSDIKAKLDVTPMQIVVAMLSDETFTLDVKANDAIYELK